MTTPIVIDLDYSAIIYLFPDVETLKGQVDALLFELDDCFDWQTVKPIFLGVQYTHSAKSLRGCVLGYNIQDDGQVRCQLKISSEPLKARSDRFFYGLAVLDPYFIACTRLDPHLDIQGDYLPILRDSMAESFYAKNHSGFNRHKPISSHKWNGDELETKTTFYFGSRDASTYIRIYDKDNGVVRFEVESKRYKSEHLYRYLITSVQNNIPEEVFLREMFNQSIAHINFYTDKADKNLNRNEVAPFWSDFLLLINQSSTRIPSPSLPLTIQRTLNWLDRQVMTSFAFAREYYGSYFQDYLNRFLATGLERLSPKQKLLVDMFACV